MISSDKHSALVISLDLELLWGDERWVKDGYAESHVGHVHEVMDRLLTLFAEYGIHATVDYVGEVAEGGDQLYHAPDIINRLKSEPNIELATHTYSHYRLPEENHSLEGFENDLAKAIASAAQQGIDFRTIVFPRNEINGEALAACLHHGITIYRGSATRFFEQKKTWVGVQWQRVCRLMDAYINIGGYTSNPWPVKQAPINVQASRFLRPYMPSLAFLERLRLRRIQQEMEHAARKGEVYHLWWHPHNMGAHIDENFRFLRRVLEVYRRCHEQYGMQSMTMAEVARK